MLNQELGDGVCGVAMFLKNKKRQEQFTELPLLRVRSNSVR